MRCVVQKYGGSSVADVERMGRVADRIAATHAQGIGVVAVVSAMGHTTNDLLTLAHQVSDAPSRRELDMLVSVGERISMALLAMALHARGVPAMSLTGSQSGIVTDEQHADARVVEVRPERLRGVLEAGKVAIVAGFQGVSRTREVTTLGRGGSDTTAVVLAAALGAEHCEICSDVDGVWSSDPRVVADAVKLETLGLEQTLALARGGAKVLYEDAVRYARDQGVQIVARATFGPGSGTRITAGNTQEGPVLAVTGDAQLLRVDATGAAWDAVVAAATDGGGRVRRRVGQVLYLDTRNVHGEIGWPSGVRAEPAAVVTLVGSAVGERMDVAGQAEARLRAAGVAVLAAGGSGDALWWGVEPASLNDAVRSLHGMRSGR